VSTRGASVPPFPPGYRASGVLLHVTSLPSPYGIGDLGPAAFAWVDRLHEAGQRWWQALPLGPTGYGDSPYQCLSSFAGNELLISPDGLIDDGLLQAADCAGQAFSPSAVEYEKVVPFKRRLLETAWSRFSAGARPDLWPAYERFCQAHGLWLDDYALFRALKARYSDACYLEWPVELVRRTSVALDQVRRELATQIDVVRFAQFLLSRQAERLEQHAHDKGVRLIGDLPFFVSPDSSDIWANPELFLLGKDHHPTVVAGVPPDYFSADGQLWGNPVYDWDALRESGYRWCVDRVRGSLARASGSRDGPDGPLGPRPGRRVLQGRREGPRRPALHRRRPGVDHARRDRAARSGPPARHAGPPGSPSTARRTTRTCPTITLPTRSCTRAPTTIPPREAGMKTSHASSSRTCGAISGAPQALHPRWRQP
jgi:hypothetical protein